MADGTCGSTMKNTESNVTRKWDVTTSTPILTYGVVAAEVVRVLPKRNHIDIPPSAQPSTNGSGKDVEGGKAGGSKMSSDGE